MLLVLMALVLGASSAKAQDDAMIKRGKMLWTNRGCNSCHAIGKKMAGPALAGLQARRSGEWIHRWLKETDVMLTSDSTAMGMLAEWKNIKMPKQAFTDQDIDAILAYMSAEEAKMKK